jgi:hypothetical protein
VVFLFCGGKTPSWDGFRSETDSVCHGIYRKGTTNKIKISSAYLIVGTKLLMLVSMQNIRQAGVVRKYPSPSTNRLII